MSTPPPPPPPLAPLDHVVSWDHPETRIPNSFLSECKVPPGGMLVECRVGNRDGSPFTLIDRYLNGRAVLSPGKSVSFGGIRSHHDLPTADGKVRRFLVTDPAI